MKNTRKTITMAADKAREKFHLEGDTNAVLLEAVNISLSTFNDFVTEGHTKDEEKAAMAPVNGALNLYHDALRLDRLEALTALGQKDGLSAYLDDQSVPGYRIVSEGDAYLLEETPVSLASYDVISTLCRLELPRILDGVCIFADNCAKFMSHDDGAYVTRLAMNASYTAVRARMGWDEYDSKTKLSAQLTELAGWIFGDLAPKMIAPDVTFIINGAIASKSKTNIAGSYQMRDEKTVLDFIVRAVYTRKNSLPYAFQGSGSAYGAKAALSTVPNKAMAESAAKESKPTKAVSETVKKAPAKKTTKKEAPGMTIKTASEAKAEIEAAKK